MGYGCQVGLLVMSVVLAQPGWSQTGSTAMPSMEEQIAKQEAKVKELIGQMIELDATIQAQIDKVVNNLKSITDSPDSGTRLSFVKQEAIKKLSEGIKRYQAERARRLTAMRTGQSYLTKEQLTNDLALIDARIEMRVTDIVELAGSFEKHNDYKQYDAFGGASEQQRHNRRQDSRGNIIQEKLEKGLDADAEKLQNEVATLKRDLPYKTGKDRELIEEQIRKDEELIRKRREQADKSGAGFAKAQEREVSAREAFRVEQDLKREGAEIKANMQKLTALRYQYDAARNSLNISRQVMLKNKQSAQ
jgi:hypothetical protein